MEMEDLLFIEDDLDILDIINYGFPRRNYERSEYFDTMDDLSFFKRFRLRKPTVLQILELIEEELEFDNEKNHSVSPINQLLTALRIYSSAGHQISIADFIGIHQSTVSRILKRVTHAIARLRPAFISMPTEEERLRIATDFYSIARFPRVLGCVDGTHIRMQSPGGEDAEIFRNRKSYFSINTQVICDSKLKIRDIVARWPGSAHDLTIFNNSRIRARLENDEFHNSILLGDSGYANRNYLLVPLRDPTTPSQSLYNESHIATRNCVERLFGVWKRRFPILAYGLRYSPEMSSAIIVATAVVHNIAMDNNEQEPPIPDDLDVNQLNYLIQLGNIGRNLNPELGQQNAVYDVRQQLINTYFARL